MKGMLVALPLALMLFGCKEREPDQQIIFAAKAYYESPGQGPGSVYIAGTLTGEGVAYPNNTTAIVCDEVRKECLTYSIEQIGPNQVGRLASPLSYPIVRWGRDEIVASGEGDAIDCSRATITIVRKSETVVWVTEPINQSEARCKNSNTKIMKWTIEDSPRWAAMFHK